jgi:hypothetical protein
VSRRFLWISLADPWRASAQYRWDAAQRVDQVQHMTLVPLHSNQYHCDPIQEEQTWANYTLVELEAGFHGDQQMYAS